MGPKIGCKKPAPLTAQILSLSSFRYGRWREGMGPGRSGCRILLLRELGRIGIGLPELQIAMEQALSLRFLPLDLPQLNEFAAHTGIRDPFDRLILSACRVLEAKRVTKDRSLRDSGLVHTVWR